MVRKHGWNLPFHTFQVVAITVFCLLAVAFYIFLAPFLGSHIWEYVLIGIYSPVALVVFLLYIRCTAINPADPGILSEVNHPPLHEANSKPRDGSVKDLPVELGNGIHSPSLESRSSLGATNSNKYGSGREGLEINDPIPQTTKNVIRNACGIIMCGVFVHEDCRKEYTSDQQEGNSEDALYCTLCKAEVRQFSKHCRSCDKCVDGFDHHCRWLNNCVGRKNYYTFISLMAFSLVWLAIEAGVGVGVFVRCFVNKRSMEADITDRLGNGFSRAPFAAVVAVCTAVSILAFVPLGELFFFHVILIKKGITTYEFVVAMREAPLVGTGSLDAQLANILDSPSGSTATGFSGGSSRGNHYKGAWCTPPRVFVDYQDEVIPHLEPGMVPSTVDPDSAGQNKAPKKSVKRSAWKLVKLDANEAAKAAAKARASSSVLRPIEGRSRLPEVEYSSSGNISIQSSVSTEISGGISNSYSKEIKNEYGISSLKNSAALSQGSRDEYESGTHSLSSISSPSHIHENVTLSPLPRRIHEPSQFIAGVGPSLPRMVNPAQASTSGDPLASALGGGMDEKMAKRESNTDPLLLSSAVASASLLRDMRRTSVVWDQEAGRYVSVPTTTSTEAWNQHRLTLPTNRFSSNANNGESIGYNSRRPAVPQRPPPEEPASSSGRGRTTAVAAADAASPGKPSEKLVYTGESIFFGGPLLSGLSGRDASARNGKEQVFRVAPQRFGQPGISVSSQPDIRFKRDAGSNQLPVFAPGGGVGLGFSAAGPSR